VTHEYRFLRVYGISVLGRSIESCGVLGHGHRAAAFAAESFAVRQDDGVAEAILSRLGLAAWPALSNLILSADALADPKINLLVTRLKRSRLHRFNILHAVHFAMGCVTDRFINCLSHQPCWKRCCYHSCDHISLRPFALSPWALEMPRTRWRRLPKS
jgi:hypothetical protein